MQCLPAGFSLATLTPIKCSSTDRVARRAPLCTHANLFAGFSTQLMKVLLRTFPKPKKEHLEAQRVERVHTWIKGNLYLGKICTVHLTLAIRITRHYEFKSSFIIQNFMLPLQNKQKGEETSKGRWKKCRGVELKSRRNGPRESYTESNCQYSREWTRRYLFL